MSSQIPANVAKAYIDNYRQGLPPGSLRSAWIDRSFIDAILTLSTTHALDGVRVYLARYTDNINVPGLTAVSGDETVIIVPTEEDESGSRQDVDSAYYDYSHVCPPYCDGDIGG